MIPVLGIIENMSYFKGDDGKTYEIFGKGGGEKVAKDFNIDLFGKIPIVQQIREQGDIGEPLVHADPSHEVSQLYIKIANDLAGKIAKLNHEVNLKREKMVYEELDLM